MQYEIDFLPVGDNSKSGDAISIRFGEILKPGSQTVIVVDGGTRDSGKALVKHIKKYYQQDHVDHIILTHHHNDHSAGLQDVIEGLSIGNIWMHKPWERADGILEWISDGRRTENSVSKYLTESLRNSLLLDQLATEYSIPIIEPYSGTNICPEVSVIGPDIEYLSECCAHYIEETTRTDNYLMKGLAALKEVVKEIIRETFNVELLGDPSESEQDAVNDSSVILLLKLGTRSILLPGDAGPFALRRALDFSEAKGERIYRPDLFKIPHHGSKHNLGTSLCKHLFGDIDDKYTDDSTLEKSATASVAPNGKPKHPSYLVTNALRRRGYKTNETSGSTLCYKYNAPTREGWTKAKIIPFMSEIEE